MPHPSEQPRGLSVTTSPRHVPGRRRAPGALALPALACVLLAGCIGPPDSTHVPLLYEHETIAETEWTSVPALLSARKHDRETGETRYYALWPAFGWSENGRERELRFFGAPVYQKRIDPAGFVDLDVIAGPVLYGRSRDEGSYLTILPFGGTLKGKFGKDHIGWVLPPLYVYARDHVVGGTKISHNILFPLVNWVHGGGYAGFRILPLYAHYTRHDREGRLAWERTNILWPLWSSYRLNVNTRGKEQRGWFLWPLFGRYEGPGTSGWEALWPLFRYRENRTTYGGGPYWELRAPFPFVIVGRGRTSRRTDLWPLWGHRERRLSLSFGKGYDAWERYFALWPIWRWERHDTPQFRDRKWYFLPLLWSYARDPQPGRDGPSTRTFKLWPLLRYKRHADGRTTLNLISPLWFNDPEGAFEAIYNPLTRIYERQSRGERKWLLLLWGLYQQHETARSHWSIVHPWLFWDYERNDGSERDTALLFGLFRYVRHGNKKALRLFWLPEWPRWGGGDGR
ncbi:MAG: hypothetical protein D6776_06475 [Planctomycetota bacterium]|nr:MAG: hypothetical protein D6776_06475 [Planctomycetota bacterium]